MSFFKILFHQLIHLPSLFVITNRLWIQEFLIFLQPKVLAQKLSVLNIQIQSSFLQNQTSHSPLHLKSWCSCQQMQVGPLPLFTIQSRLSHVIRRLLAAHRIVFLPNVTFIQLKLPQRSFRHLKQFIQPCMLLHILTIKHFFNLRRLMLLKVSKTRFCNTQNVIKFEQLQFNKPILWPTQPAQILEENSDMPQSVLASRLRYLNSRNKFFQTLEAFSLSKTSPKYYRKALYEVLAVEESCKLNYQTKVEPEDIQQIGLQLSLPLDSIQINSIRFILNQRSITNLLGFLDATIAHLNSFGDQFQEIAFNNIVTNLARILLDVGKRGPDVSQKLNELVSTFARIFENNDYLADAQAINISALLGKINEICITHHLTFEPEIKRTFTRTSQNFITKFSDIQQIQNPLQITDYKYMIYTLFLSDLIPESISSQIINSYANCGLELSNFYPQIELMGMMLMHNIKCTESFLKKMQTIKKPRLSIIDMFVLTKSFELAQVSLNEFCITLYQDIYFIMYQDKINPDLNQLLMYIRVLRDVFSSSFSTSRQGIDRRNDRLLPYVEKLLTRLVPIQAKFNHILFVANTFNMHLKQPVFLIDMLYANKNSIEITNQTLSIYTEFLEITYDFYREKLSTNFRIDTKERQNTMPGAKYADLVNFVISKLVENEQILVDKDISLTMLKIMKIKYFDLPFVIVNKFVEIFLLSSPEVQKHIQLLARVFYVQEICVDQFPQLIKFVSQQNQLQYLETIYYLLMGSREFCCLEKGLVENYKLYITELLGKNQIELQEQQRIEGVLHSFPNFIKSDQLDGYEYILPTLDMLKIQSFPGLTESFAVQMKKIIKRLQGDLLIENLILLEKYQIRNYELYVSAAECLTSCFTFFKDSSTFEPKGLFTSENRIYQLLSAYIKQAKSTDQVYHEGLKIISYLAHLVFPRLSLEEIEQICKILGPNKEMYYPEFAAQLQKMRIPQGAIVKVASELVISNMHLKNNLARLIVQTPVQRLKVDILKASRNHKIFIPDIDNLFVSTKDKKKYISLILENLVHTWNYKNSILEIMDYANKHYSNLDMNSKINYLTLSILSKAMNCTNFTTHPQEGYFKILFRESELVISEEDKQRYDEIIQSSEYAVRTERQKQYNSYPSILIDHDYRNQAVWKTYCITGTSQLGNSKLYPFLSRQISMKHNQTLAKPLELLGFLDLNHQIVVPELVFDNLVRNSKHDQQILKQDEDYANFLMSVTISVPVVQEGRIYNHTVNHQIDERLSISVLIAKEDERFKFQYIHHEEIVQTAEEISISPIAMLKLLHMSEDEPLYAIYYDEWIKYQSSKKKQQDFLFRILNQKGNS